MTARASVSSEHWAGASSSSTLAELFERRSVVSAVACSRTSARVSGLSSKAYRARKSQDEKKYVQVQEWSRVGSRVRASQTTEEESWG